MKKSTINFDSKTFLQNVTSKPGVYQMIGREGEILYVGKARDLKKRLATYFQRQKKPPKTEKMLAQVRQVELIVTPSERDALLLESNLIKQHHPRYNVLLRDDKSYPYLYLSDHETFPRLTFHRGAKRAKGSYFGPYPSVTAVRETLNFLQKAFKIRQCENSFFSHRSRPCLQYQIKRCTAPCVDYITPEAYAEDLKHTKMFLQGKSQQLINDLIDQMERAAAEKIYEKAAQYRDQIQSLRKVQAQQLIHGKSGDIDVLGVAVSANKACVQVLFIREGRILGNKVFYPVLPVGTEAVDVLPAFLSQYYLRLPASNFPKIILLPAVLSEKDWFEQSLSEYAKQSVQLIHSTRGTRLRWLRMAEQNAREALANRLAAYNNTQQNLETLQDDLGMDALPQRLECFDISHTSGEATVGSCVVFEIQGPVFADYRRFNITGITPGDDYAAMYQALTRRYMKVKKGLGKLPDLLVIDGGKGQLTQALHVLEELQFTDVWVLGIAKGEGRKPGLETIYLSRFGVPPKPVNLQPQALHLLQHIRDEAHRFAITGHRTRRDQKRKVSTLEAIPGIGPKRRKALLVRFGGLQELTKASVDEIAKTPGISRTLAEQLYQALH